MHYRSIGRWLTVGIAVFGAWSLYCQSCAIFRASFATLKAGSAFPVLAALILLIYWTGKGETEVDVSRTGESRSSANLRVP